MVDLGRTGVVLTCPACGDALSPQPTAFRCESCGESVPVVDGIPEFPVTDVDPALPPVFDLLASVYDTPVWFPIVYRLLGGPHAPADDRALLADALAPSGDELLDVACGTGRFTRSIADEAAHVWGIDVSRGMLQRAQRYAVRDGLETVAFARMSADEIRFADEAFDGVACCWALHLFADVSRAITEMHRVLTSGGRLVGTTLSETGLLALPGMQRLRDAIGVSTYGLEELRDLLFDAGFSTVQFERYGAALFFSAEKCVLPEQN